MIDKLLIKKVGGDSPNYENKIFRTKLGSWTAIVGIFCNVLLTITKLGIGYISGSISIIADAMNNLTDSASSIVSVIGIKLSGRASDREHPHGHGRWEYLATLFISCVILFVGINILVNSIKGIFNPNHIIFNYLSLILLILSILVKLWMYFFYKSIAIRINSTPLKAASVDSLSDVLVTSIVVASYISSLFTKFPTDAIGGLLVSIFILKSSVDLINETISSLLGDEANENLKEKILSEFNNYSEIIDTHDLNVHYYGPTRIYATIDAMVSPETSIIRLHKVFTEIEHLIHHKYDVFLNIHMDVAIESSAERKLKVLLDQYCNAHNEILSYHDEAVVKTEHGTFVVLHLNVDGNIIKNNDDEEKVISTLKCYLNNTLEVDGKSFSEQNIDNQYNIFIDKVYKD